MHRRFHAAVTVTVATLLSSLVLPSPASASALVGQWSSPFELGGVAIHASLLRTGEVLLFQDVEGTPGVDRSSRVRIWNYLTGATRDANLGYDRDLFCASQSLLPDGRVYAAGGHSTAAGKKQDAVGIATTDIYDPSAQQWTPGPVMGQARWYPTNVMQPNGKTLTFGGHATSASPSRTVDSFDPSTNTITALPPGATKTVGLNPRMHLLPDGRIAKTGPPAVTSYFNPVANTWSNGPKMKYGARARGVSILLPDLSKVLQIGGYAGAGAPTNTAEILDTAAPTPAWRYTAPMANPRLLHNAVVLPDGQVLVVGGGAKFKFTGPELTPEMFDPVAETWSTMADQQGGRMYHATLLLLPDGRVLSAGQDNGPLASQGEIFSPPYLFKGPRPTIAAAPSQTGYGQSIEISSPEAGSVQKVVLMKPGSMTHQIDTDQRHVGLGFSVSGTTISTTSPANAAVAPPGDYMLFLVNAQGVPSEASWVRVNG